MVKLSLSRRSCNSLVDVQGVNIQRIKHSENIVLRISKTRLDLECSSLVIDKYPSGTSAETTKTKSKDP